MRFAGGSPNKILFISLRATGEPHRIFSHTFAAIRNKPSPDSHAALRARAAGGRSPRPRRAPLPASARSPSPKLSLPAGARLPPRAEPAAALGHPRAPAAPAAAPRSPLPPPPRLPPEPPYLPPRTKPTSVPPPAAGTGAVPTCGGGPRGRRRRRRWRGWRRRWGGGAGAGAAAAGRLPEGAVGGEVGGSVGGDGAAQPLHGQHQGHRGRRHLEAKQRGERPAPRRPLRLTPPRPLGRHTSRYTYIKKYTRI